jgi:hypothetical protein
MPHETSRIRTSASTGNRANVSIRQCHALKTSTPSRRVRTTFLAIRWFLAFGRRWASMHMCSDPPKKLIPTSFHSLPWNSYQRQTLRPHARPIKRPDKHRYSRSRNSQITVFPQRLVRKPRPANGRVTVAHMRLRRCRVPFVTASWTPSRMKDLTRSGWSLIYLMGESGEVFQERREGARMVVHCSDLSVFAVFDVLFPLLRVQHGF